jgi:hypothetical protein
MTWVPAAVVDLDDCRTPVDEIDQDPVASCNWIHYYRVPTCSLGVWMQDPFLRAQTATYIVLCSSYFLHVNGLALVGGRRSTYSCYCKFAARSFPTCSLVNDMFGKQRILLATRLVCRTIRRGQLSFNFPWLFPTLIMRETLGTEIKRNTMHGLPDKGF